MAEMLENGRSDCFGQKSGAFEEFDFHFSINFTFRRQTILRFSQRKRKPFWSIELEGFERLKILQLSRLC
ncbi:MAG: hypothetical protein AAGL89_16085 [Pseudomonadota bacterium]